MIPKKNLLNRLKKTPHIRIALVVAVASVLLLATMGTQISPVSAKSEIHATGTYLTTGLLPDEHQRTSGDLTIFLRLLHSKYVGDLQGDAVAEALIVQDNVVEKVGFPRSDGTFRGTLNGGSEKGTFAYTTHWVADRTACPCPPGLNPIDGNFVIIEGTGTGAFEGICGGGTFNIPAGGLPATYDYTFRFGKDCKANN